jgi:hypothetical protein
MDINMFLYVPNGSKIDEMSIKLTNIVHCKTLQNLPKLALHMGLKIFHLATLSPSRRMFTANLFL